MNEAPQRPRTPEHLMYENAITNNPDFLKDLQSAVDLGDIIDALEKHTYVDGVGDYLFFEVGNSDGEAIEVTPFPTEEFVQLLSEFTHDAPDEAKEIDMKIKHVELNKAVKRVLAISK